MPARMDRSERTAKHPDQLRARPAPRERLAPPRSTLVAAAVPLLLLVGASIGRAEPYPARAAAVMRRSELATNAVPTRAPERPVAVRAGAARGAVERARPPVDPEVARRVFAARLRPTGGSVIERGSVWAEVPEPPPQRPLLPKIYPTVMGFPTGGGGVKLKFRY